MVKVSKPLLKILQIQIFMASILGLPLFFFRVDSTVAILSALTVVVVPGLYTLFVSSLPLKSGSTGIGRVLKAEIGKYFITLSLLIGIFVSVEDLNPVIFFVSLLVLYFSPALLPFVTSTDKDKFL